MLLVPSRDVPPPARRPGAAKITGASIAGIHCRKGCHHDHTGQLPPLIAVNSDLALSQLLPILFR
jgi:hypothetical protein